MPEMTLLRRRSALIGLCLLAVPHWLIATPGVHAADGIQKVEIDGTRFRVTTSDGDVLSQSALIGAVLTLDDAKGARITFRIDEAIPDPKDPSGEIILYRFMVRDAATGRWRNMCGPDPDGVSMGFPLAGVWSSAGEHLASGQTFNLTCTSGANAKCVRMGYKPWKKTEDGTPLWKHHQACTRMMRADYCGDGVSYTKDGTLINIYDRKGIQVSDPSLGLDFEAAWGPDGAVCVRKVRIPEKTSLDALVRSCPRRLKGRVGPVCTRRDAEKMPGTLIMNDS